MKEYFPHDFNARHDRKIAALVSKHRAAGYGIFWATCEMMHEEGGSLELDEITYAAIAKHVNENEVLLKNVIEDCIHKFKLFFLQDEKLTSNRVKKNIHKVLTISEIRAKAGKSGANAKQKKANAKQTAAKFTVKKSKEDIVKESKEKSSPSANILKNSNLFRQPNIPKIEEVREVFLRQGGTEEMATSFFNKSEGLGWFINGSPITNFANLVPNYVKSWKEREKNNSGGRQITEIKTPYIKKESETNFEKYNKKNHHGL